MVAWGWPDQAATVQLTGTVRMYMYVRMYMCVCMYMYMCMRVNYRKIYLSKKSRLQTEELPSEGSEASYCAADVTASTKRLSFAQQ